MEGVGSSGLLELIHYLRMVQDMRIMNWFGRAPRDGFLPHEKTVLEAVRRELGPAMGALFDDQIASVNHVTRLGNGREVGMYRMVGRQVTFPSSRLKDDNEEAVLATVVLETPIKNVRPVGKLWVVNGHLFEIRFNAELDKLRTVTAVASVKLGSDFSEVPVRSETRLVEIKSGVFADKACPPLSAERQSNAIRLVGISLPDDYLDAMSKSNGFTLRGWRILGLEELYDTPGDPASRVIGERRTVSPDAPDLALIVRNRQYFVIRMDDESEVSYGDQGLFEVLAAKRD